MDSYDTQSPHTLSDAQMAILVAVVLQEFGAGLIQAQFNEVMLAIFEHIPGFETLPHRLSVRYRRILWSKYQQAIQVNQRRH